MYNVKIFIRFVDIKTTAKNCYEMFKLPFIPTKGLVLQIARNLKYKICEDVIWNLEEDCFEIILNSQYIDSFDKIPFEFHSWNFI